MVEAADTPVEVSKPRVEADGPRHRVHPSADQIGKRLLRHLHASFYDAAEPDLDPKHWGRALSLSANAAMDKQAREQLRSRARYEIANNSLANGMVQRKVDDTIGTGPRLNITTGSMKLDREIEAIWREWADAVDFAEKCRIIYRAGPESGEIFSAFITNPELAGLPVMLDLSLIECDRVTSDYGGEEDNEVDGVFFDENNIPTEYRVLKYHPGDHSRKYNDPTDSKLIRAENMLHWFRPIRPEQMRGIPWISPALPLFGLQRRFTLASVRAAETAASFAGVLQTDAPSGEEDDVEPFDVIELEHNLLTTLPFGWKLGQIDSKQPIVQFAEFKKAITMEICNCLQMPYNIAAADSSEHNYASARADHQGYFKAIQVERSRFESRILRRVVREFLRELVRSTNIRSARLRNGKYRINFFWDAFPHVDPLKEEKARTERFNNGSTSEQEEAAKDGVDWLERLDYQKQANEERRKRGLPERTYGAEPVADPETDLDEKAKEAADEAVSESRRKK
ncbi:MAG: phage portal protein [Phycisphaerales bacterium JB065]